MLLGVQAELSVIMLDLNLVIFLTLDLLSILSGSLTKNMIYLCFNMTELLLTCSHPVIFLFCKILGMAHGLNILFGWDLIACVFLTATGAVFHLLLFVLLVSIFI